MPVRTAERIEFLGDIITSAVEGGTGYWARVSQYQYVSPLSSDDGKVVVYTGERNGDEARATLHEMNDDESGYKDEPLELTIDKIASAIGKLLRGEVGVNSTILRYIKLGDKENDAGEIDSDAADVIAQVALLGEIVYG